MRHRRSDHILDFVVEAAKERIRPTKVILYGSRARGDEDERSDYDIAFVGADPERWAEFALYIDENAPTLLEIDLVQYEKASGNLQKSIDEEGVVLHESKT